MHQMEIRRVDDDVPLVIYADSLQIFPDCVWFVYNPRKIKGKKYERVPLYPGEVVTIRPVEKY